MAELPAPISIYPERFVENVYPVSGQPDRPDLPSHNTATAYLFERYAPRPPEGSDPSVVYVPVEVQQTEIGGHLVWPRTDHPRDQYPTYLPPKKEGRQFSRWVRANVIGLLALNIALNVDQIPNLVRDGIEAGQVVKDKIEDKLHKGEITVEAVDYSFHTEQKTVPGGPVTDEMFAPSAVGEAAPTPSAVEQFFAQLQELQSRGVVIDKAPILGRASDDWKSNPDCDLGIASDDNANLALNRAKAFKEIITTEAAARGIQLPELEIINVNPKPADLAEAEKQLSADERLVAEALAQQFGYPDFCTATTIYGRDPDSLPPSLRSFIDTRIGKQRGTTAAFQGHIGDQQITIVIPDVHKFLEKKLDGSPNKSHEYDLDLALFLIPPIPGLHKRPGTRTVMEKRIIPGVDGEDEWLRIYEEGANPDRTLKKEAWAYTRKYQEMLRDDRIKHVYNLEYLDDASQKQVMRILFADHTPDAETIANFPVMLQSIIQMDKGNIGHNLDAIVVFPEENAGIKGNNPKQIGLGIDYQDERNILGVAYYSLGLVEMHMPVKPTTEDMHSQLGALWTFVHETAGHFIDHNQKPAMLTPIDSRLQRHFVVSGQQARLGSEEFARLRSLERGEVPQRTLRDRIMRRYPEDTQRRWWVRRGLETVPGTINRRHDTVPDDDRRLKEALLVRIQNRFPTRYSRTNRGEFWAESAAQVTTRIGIGFGEQADMRAGNRPNDPRFATTYAVGTRTLELVQREAGAQLGSDGLEWPNPVAAAQNWVHTMTTVENDAHLEPLARQARTWDFRSAEDPRVWHILARARRSQKPIE